MNGISNKNSMNEKSTLVSKMRDRESMESGLLGREREEIRNEDFGAITIAVILEEAKQLGSITGPMVAMNWSQYLSQIISILMVGNLDELALPSTTIALSFCTVSGYSLLLGMASVLDALYGQAFGAKQYRKLGIQTGTAILCLLLVCIPLSLILLFTGKILVLMGQDPEIAKEAGKFATMLIPSLFACGTLQALIEYFQTQSLIIPLLVSASASLCCHVPLCWALVFKSGLGHLRAAALSIGISYWLNVIFLVLYMRCSPACANTRVPISSELFRGFRDFYRLAIPSALMVCLEWWSLELLTLLSGFLPHPEIETSLLSVCLLTLAAVFTIAEGLGAAASTRVSNELDAGNPRAARVVAGTAVFLVVLQSVIVSSTLYANRRAFGYLFSHQKEVVNYVTDMAPLICLSVILDSLHGVLSGIARGCRWQELGAFVKFCAFYLFGIPIGIALGFWLDMRGKGLWIGLLAGSFLQAFLLSLITISTDWEEKARRARKRIFRGRYLEDNSSSEQRTLLS